MGTLYVTEAGVQVHKEGQRLLIKKNGEVLQDIPMIKVDRVMLVGRGVSITTPTLYALAERKVGVFYLNSGGRMVASVGSAHGHSRVRQAQVRACDDPVRALTLAQAIVSAKVSNQRALVQRHSEGRPEARAMLDVMEEQRREVSAARGLDDLRGREGLAARAYFDLLRRLLRPPAGGRNWGFERRAYHPAPDPVNALLSFAYSLLLNDVTAACYLAGLDPDLGFFHTIDYNKPSLALDLEEEFRPVIADSVVLLSINRPLLGLDDFETGQPRTPGEAEDTVQPVEPALQTPTAGQGARAVYLKDAARKRFIDLYEKRVNEQVVYPPTGEKTSYRRIFELQAYAVARTVLGEQPAYQPFTIR